MLEIGYNYLKRFGVRGILGRYLLYKSECKIFVQSAKTLEEKAVRRNLLRNFLRIHKNLPCGHSPFQFVEMAKYVFDLDIDGPMVECGCAQGGSTAKLSILARETNRRLFVCDSFEGMPPCPGGIEQITYAGTSNVPSCTIYEGKFSTTLDGVKRNITKYGCIEVCEFIPGYFEKTLPTLNIDPVFVYTDVAIVNSARDCLKSLWPQLKPGGYWFTHEASYMEYVLGTFNHEWWLQTFQEPPPLVIGAGCGISVLSPSLAYFQKPLGKRPLRRES